MGVSKSDLPQVQRPPTPDRTSVLRLKRDRKFEWGLRHDVRRILLYEQSVDSRSVSQAGFLHPAEAVILTSFDGRRTLVEVDRDVAFLFDLIPEESAAAVDRVRMRWAQALETHVDGSIAISYDPRNFIIPASDVDLVTKKLYKPITLVAHVSSDCMRNCIYCNIQKRKTRDVRLLPLTRWKGLAAECAEAGVLSVFLGGGDPFMRSDVVEIIGAFIDNGIQPFVATKSYVSPSKAQELAGRGLVWIQVSIDSCVPETANFLTGSPSYFNQIVETIRNLKAAGLRVRSNSVATKYNVRQIPDLAVLLLDLGVEVIRVTPVGRSLYVPGTELLFVSREDSNWLRKRLRELRGPHDVNYSDSVDIHSGSPEEKRRAFANRSLCSAGCWGFVMHSDGKVTLCEEMPLEGMHIIGDLSAQDLMEVWQSPHIEKMTNPPREKFLGTVCYDCTDFDECHGGRGRCFRDALKAYGSFYAPTPSCPRAPVGLRLS